MSNSIGEAAEGMVAWAEAMLGKAKQEIATTKSQVDDGFTSDDAVDTAVRLTNLWFSGMASFANEMMDAATTIAKYTAAKAVKSDHTAVGKKGAWHLKISGPATCKGNGSPQLPESVLAVAPTPVDGTAGTFVVTANVVGKPSGIYEGTVTATAADGSGTTDVPYVLQVP